MANILKGQMETHEGDVLYPKTSWDMIEGKPNVGKVDLVDNLTTDDGTKALSARQGKVLGDTLNRIGESVVLWEGAGYGYSFTVELTDNIYNYDLVLFMSTQTQHEYIIFSPILQDETKIHTHSVYWKDKPVYVNFMATLSKNNNNIYFEGADWVNASNNNGIRCEKIVGIKLKGRG